MPANRTKETLADGGTVLGLPVFEFVTPGIGRILEAGGADFALFDMEHAGFGIDTIRAAVSYCRGTSVSPFVRVPTNRPEYISSVLDAGAQGVMVPMIETREQAEAFVAAARYAPDGRRGVAHGIAHDDFLPGDPAQKMLEGNREVLTIGMIETATGLANVTEIAECPGLDVLWIGHFDLAASLGVAGQIEGPELQRAFDVIAGAAAGAGKVAGRGVMNVESALTWIGRGFRAFTYSRDIVLVRDALATELGSIRERMTAARP